MEKETPTESIPERLNRKEKERLDANTAELKELAKDVDSSETPTEEWVEIENQYLRRDLNGLKQAIRSLLSSHDAELRRKIEGMRKDTSTWTGHEQLVNMTVYNEALDAVLALLSTKK